MQRTFLPPFSPPVQKALILLVALALATIAALSSMARGTVDWLLLSGGLTLLVGIHQAHAIPEALERTLRRIWDRGVLQSGSSLDELTGELETAVVTRWAPIGGAVVAASIALAFAGAFPSGQLLSRIPLVVTEVCGGYLAGCYLGRMACYGRLGKFLRRRGDALRLIPGHPDGVGGWTPIGNFFFFQAAVAGVPAAFLAIWLLLIRFSAFQERYFRWQEPYGYLLALAIAIEIGAFLLPLWSFHRTMLEQKGQLQREADRLSSEIADLQRRLATTHPGTDLDALKQSLSNLSARYWAIEQLPEWPVSPETRRMFSFSNLALSFPLAAEYLGLSKEWADLLQNLFRP